jgi:probable HAF family extracellular repeat protein
MPVDFWHAFLWQGGQMIDLGVMGGGVVDGSMYRYSTAIAINDLGLVVGYGTADFPCSYFPITTHGFVIAPEDADGDDLPDVWFRDDDGDGNNDLMIHLGVCYGDNYSNMSTAYAVNNWGQIVGLTDHGAEIGSGTAFLINPVDVNLDGFVDWFWDSDANGDDLNDLMIDLGLGEGSEAVDINDAGQIVGILRSQSGRAYAGFLITPDDTDGDGLPDVWVRDEDGDGINDLAVELGPPPRGEVWGVAAVNSSGQVVGSWKSKSGAIRAVRWDVDAQGDVTVTDLGRVSGEKHTGASDINDTGQVVGTGSTSSVHQPPDEWTHTACLWENGTMTLLKDLVGDSGGLDKANLTARAINASGEIIGWCGDYSYIAIPSPPDE